MKAAQCSTDDLFAEADRLGVWSEKKSLFLSQETEMKILCDGVLVSKGGDGTFASLPCSERGQKCHHTFFVHGTRLEDPGDVGGGGRPDMAQAGGKQPERLPEALKAVYEIVARVKR
jgi:hypothetical protein